jgi:hypothetical protein
LDSTRKFQKPDFPAGRAEMPREIGQDGMMVVIVRCTLSETDDSGTSSREHPGLGGGQQTPSRRELQELVVDIFVNNVSPKQEHACG